MKNWFPPKAIRSPYTVLRNFEKLRKAIINQVKYTVKWDFTNKMGSVFFIFFKLKCTEGGSNNSAGLKNWLSAGSDISATKSEGILKSQKKKKGQSMSSTHAIFRMMFRYFDFSNSKSGKENHSVHWGINPLKSTTLLFYSFLPSPAGLS